MNIRRREEKGKCPEREAERHKQHPPRHPPQGRSARGNKLQSPRCFRYLSLQRQHIFTALYIQIYIYIYIYRYIYIYTYIYIDYRTHFCMMSAWGMACWWDTLSSIKYIFNATVSNLRLGCSLYPLLLPLCRLPYLLSPVCLYLLIWLSIRGLLLLSPPVLLCLSLSLTLPPDALCCLPVVARHQASLPCSSFSCCLMRSSRILHAAPRQCVSCFSWTASNKTPL